MFVGSQSSYLVKLYLRHILGYIVLLFKPFLLRNIEESKGPMNESNSFQL